MPSLATALAESKMAIDLFFNNKFSEARSLMQPWAHVSMYHSVGNSVFSLLEAMLTFEERHLGEAADALKQCTAVCQQQRRRRQTFGKQLLGGGAFKRPNYAQYTELEAHAELCSAEALLLKAMLTFVEDETMTSLLKGGIKIRSCYFSFK